VENDPLTIDDKIGCLHMINPICLLLIGHPLEQWNSNERHSREKSLVEITRNMMNS